MFKGRSFHRARNARFVSLGATGPSAIRLAAIAAAATIVSGSPAFAGPGAISLTNSTYSENFDGMGSTTALPAGWGISKNRAGAGAGVNNYGGAATSVDANLTTLSSTSTGESYAFRSSGDDAVGFLNSGTFATPNSVLFAFTNNTTSMITDLTLAWDYDKFRTGSRAWDWTFASSTDGTSFTHVAAGDQHYNADANNNSAVFPPSVVNKTGISLAGINLAVGSTYYLQWTMTGVGGTTNGQALAVNNFSLSAASQTMAGPTYFWVGNDNSLGGDGTWDASTTASWSPSDSSISSVVFDNTKTADFKGGGGTVTVDPAGVSANANIQFDVDGYTIAGGAVTLGGSTPTITVTNSSDTATFAAPINTNAGLTKGGVGTLTIIGNNSYTGGTIIAAGTLQIGNGNNTGSITGDVNDNGTLAFNRGDDTTFSGNVSGSGSINKLGGNTLVLTGNVTNAGGTTISSGTLQIGNGGSSGSLSGNVVDNATLAFNRSDDAFFSGNLSGGGSLNQNGAGRLILTGNAAHSGGTNINAGTLQVGNGDVTGSLSGDVNNNAVLAFNRSNDYVYSGNISGNGSLNQVGGGKLILTGNASHTGGTTVTSGTLQIGNGASSGSLSGNVVNNSALAFNRSDDIEFSGAISGGGGVIKSGNGALTLSGNNSYQGGTTLSAGTLRVPAASSLGSTSSTVTATRGNLYAGNGVTVANPIVVNGAPAAAITVTQDFDSLTGGWQNDSTLPGWFLFRQPAPGTAISSILLSDGNNNAGSFYSFGSAGDPDRALGGVGSGGAYFGSPLTATVAGWMAVKITNTTGNDINSFAVQYDGEEWRNGGNTSQQQMTLEYGFGDDFTTVNWNQPGGLFNFISPTVGASATALNGNDIANRSPGLGGTIGDNWVAGTNLWIRWIENNDAGNDHGLAVDNFVFTAGSAVTGGSTVTLGSDADSGVSTYSGNVSLNSPVSVTAGNNGVVAFTGTISDASGSNSITKIGAGKVILSKANTYAGGTFADEGTLQVDHSAALGGGPLSVNGGLVTASAGLGNAIHISGLSITSGLVDLNNNDLVIDYTAGNSPAGVIGSYLAMGYNGGAWNGASGIASTIAAMNAGSFVALGYGDAADLGITVDHGVTITGPAIIVKYTYYGDSSLDGKVDLGNDFNLFIQGFLGLGHGWEFGDYNYDTLVDAGDFGLFVDGFKQQGGNLGDLDSAIESSPLLSMSQKAQLVAAVPEPGSLGLLSLAACGLAARRRRK